MNAQVLTTTDHASCHPCAGHAMSGAEIVVQVLADEGCEVLFGYSGGAILPVYDAVFRYNAGHTRADGRKSMPLVVPANEQGAGFMAAGYARASGKVGVAIVTSGPGATNIVTPVRDAMADSVPMVVLSGQVATTVLGSDAFQEAQVSNIMGACAKHVFLVTEAERLEATLRSAFEIARSGRPGPVVVDIPKDVQTAPLRFDGACCLPLAGYRARLRAVESAVLDDASCAHFFDALMQSRRPLVYAGGGLISAEAAPALRRFVDAFGIPVTTTLMGLGGFDSTHPLALHMLGMHGTAYANYAVEDCDFLLALGARFDDRVAGVPDKFAPNARFIAHIDIDPAEIGKVKRANWHHVGLLADALERLTEYGRCHGLLPRLDDWRAHVAALKRDHAMGYDRSSPLIQPQAVLEAINRIAQ
ncbi:MAG: acetolactate synthase, large subunit, biosynthetic type, partial [Proteobacteria bacterium]|nr:acetolactate synthase, large subunit, biosynthetic type [Pseudomonadota bacterium]